MCILEILKTLRYFLLSNVQPDFVCSCHCLAWVKSAEICSCAVVRAQLHSRQLWQAAALTPISVMFDRANAYIYRPSCSVAHVYFDELLDAFVLRSVVPSMHRTPARSVHGVATPSIDFAMRQCAVVSGKHYGATRPPQKVCQSQH